MAHIISVLGNKGGTGKTVTITAATDSSGFFDFFVDNIQFNVDVECGVTSSTPTAVRSPRRGRS